MISPTLSRRLAKLAQVMTIEETRIVAAAAEEFRSFDALPEKVRRMIEDAEARL